MSTQTIYMYVHDTLADWEPGYAIAELHSGRFFKDNSTKYEVKTVALTQDPITTMGGVHIVPDLIIDEMQQQQAALLLLPGGNTWMEPQQQPIIQQADSFLDAGIPVAAICGATIALAQAGLLDTRKHTSNDLGFLKATCPGYHGEALYQHAPAVTDGNLITASGLAALEFAYQILQRLDVFSRETLEAWFKLYATRDAQYFVALMQSLPAR